MSRSYGYAHRVAAGVGLGLPQMTPLRPKVGSGTVLFDRLVCRNIQPRPTRVAPTRVRETFALAQGLVPTGSPLSSLFEASRPFSSFSGSPHAFVREVHHGNVIVFFYKPACGPCATIREKIKTAAGVIAAADGPPPLLSVVSAGSTCVPRAEAKEQSGSVAAAGKEEEAAHDSAGDKSAAASSSPSSSSMVMSEEDELLCAQLRDILDRRSSGSARDETGADDADSGERGTGEGDTRVRFLTVDTNDNPRLTALHDVRSLPTFVAYHGGKIVGRVEGAHAEDLLALVQQLQHVATASAAAQANDAAAQPQQPQ